MAGQGFQRREILRIMSMAAVASHFPGFTTWCFAQAHPGSAGPQNIKPAKYTPLFFAAEEYPIVERLAEIIIPTDQTPGAREAGVAEFVDFMVAHDKDRKFPFRLGLGWLNAHSDHLFGKHFLQLTPEQQVSLLEPLAYKAKYRDGEEEGRQFFEKFKELTVMGFYSSEIGYKEIQNPALKFYAESPACPHTEDPEHKHLPAPKW